MSASRNEVGEKRRQKVAAQEEKRLAKEAEQRAKEDAKQRKAEEQEEKRRAREAEQRAKDDAKQRKAEEQEEKRRVKEAEQRAKEDAKQRKAEEQAKKERSQLRLSAFFPDSKSSPPKPRHPSVTSTVNDLPLDLTASSHQPHISSQPRISRSPSIAEDSSTMAPQTDFRRHFKPQFLKPGMTIAPTNRFLTARGLVHISNALDQTVLKQTGFGAPGVDDKTARQQRLAEFRSNAGWRAEYPPVPTAKEVVLAFQRSAERPQTTAAGEVKREELEEDPMDLLDALPVKHLSFHDTRRPAYRGTFSKRPPGPSKLRRGTNPFEKALPEVDYDHDSDAEWEPEPEDAEELMSEGDDEMDTDNDADMAGFLDDTEVDMKAFGPNKRRIVDGDLVPFSTGLWWEDARGVPRPANPEDAASGIKMRSFKIEIINDRIRGPIDPFSTAYWPSVPAPMSTQINALTEAELPGQGFYPTHPSRKMPSIAPPSLATGLASKIPKTIVARRVSHDGNPKKRRLTVTASDAGVTGGRGDTMWKGGKVTLNAATLDAIKARIHDSNLTKIGLVENLRKIFPNIYRDVVYEIVGTVAERIGRHEAEKRWRIRAEWQ
ncbi:MAG: hypothetical protein M1823_000806 [Watsoniomyces obsoletus]|nr:MAG: hypothetical protein M1823_000806 [Watsoniomyces obsoletus]